MLIKMDDFLKHIIKCMILVFLVCFTIPIISGYGLESVLLFCLIAVPIGTLCLLFAPPMGL